MPSPTVVAAAATAASAATKYKAAGKAGEAAAAGYERGADFNKQMYDEAVGRAGTQMQAGDAATNRLMELLGIGPNTSAQGYGQFGGPFTMETFKADPFYQYSLNQGVKDLERTAAARGGLLSGSTIRGYKDVQSKEYENAMNRYFANKAATISPFQQLSGQQVNVLGQLANVGTNIGGNVARMYGAGGESKASQYLTQGKTLSDLYSSGSQQYGDWYNKSGPGKV
jgi:hypothetical protein